MLKFRSPCRSDLKETDTDEKVILPGVEELKSEKQHQDMLESVEKGVELKHVETIWRLVDVFKCAYRFCYNYIGICCKQVLSFHKEKEWKIKKYDYIAKNSISKVQ